MSEQPCSFLGVGKAFLSAPTCPWSCTAWSHTLGIRGAETGFGVEGPLVPGLPAERQPVQTEGVWRSGSWKLGSWCEEAGQQVAHRHTQAPQRSPWAKLC